MKMAKILKRHQIIPNLIFYRMTMKCMKFRQINSSPSLNKRNSKFKQTMIRKFYKLLTITWPQQLKINLVNNV